MCKPLAANAREAWQTALGYYKKLLDGYITFQNKKQFVLSLQNAAELVLKQIMINKNIHEVLEVDSDQTTWNSDVIAFMASTNLNSFFSTHLATRDDMIAYSIGFTKMLDYVKDGSACFPVPFSIDVKMADFKGHLTELNRLRNSAWHFGVDKNKFLSFDDHIEFGKFRSLSILVDELYRLICSQDYDPLDLNYTIGDGQMLEASDNPPPSPQITSLKRLILDSETNQRIAQYAHRKKIRLHDGEGDFREIIIDCCASALGISLEELDVRFSLMFEKKFIKQAPPEFIESMPYEDEMEDGTIIRNEIGINDYWYYFDSKLMRKK